LEAEQVLAGADEVEPVVEVVDGVEVFCTHLPKLSFHSHLDF
jgi:hypothetical protein